MYVHSFWKSLNYWSIYRMKLTEKQQEQQHRDAQYSFPHKVGSSGA